VMAHASLLVNCLSNNCVLMSGDVGLDYASKLKKAGAG
jgi:hypothetical protein